MSHHPISNEHLQTGCATCTRRKAAEAVREFSKSLSRLSETLNEADKRDVRRASRTMGMRADELETGKRHLTCENCAETEERLDAEYCRKCGAQLARADETSEDEITIRKWSDRKKRTGEDEKDNSKEAIQVFRSSANLRG